MSTEKIMFTKNKKSSLVPINNKENVWQWN